MRPFRPKDLRGGSEPDALGILVLLFLEEEEHALEQLEKCRINPSFDPNLFFRNDLEFIIPQLLSYFVMQNDLSSDDLRLLLQKASMLDFYFGHLTLFYLQSLSVICFKEQNHELLELTDFINHRFIPLMQDHYTGKRLFSVEIINKVSFMPVRTHFD